MTYIKLTAILLLILSQNLIGQINPPIDSLKAKLATEKVDTAKIILYNNISLEYRNINSDSSIWYLKQGLEYAKSTKNDKYKSLFYSWLGGNYCFRGEYIKAIEYLDSADYILKEYPNKMDLANTNYYRAIVLLSINELNQATDYALKAKDLFLEMDRKFMVGSIYVILSGIYEKLENYQKGLDYALKAYQIGIENNDSFNMPANLNNVSAMYYELGSIDSAFYYLRKAIFLNKERNQLNGLAINYYNLSNYFLESGQIDSSALYIEMAERIYAQMEYRSGLFQCYALKARIALERNDTVMATHLYKKIIASREGLVNVETLLNAYNALHDISLGNKQYKKAIEYFKAFKQIEDSLLTHSNQEILDFLNKQIEYERYQNKLEVENKEMKFRSHRKTFFLIFLSGATLILVITIILVLRLQRTKSRAIKAEKRLIEEQLECKNREITSNVMTLIRKNKALNEITTNLQEVEKKAVKVETQKAISKVAEEINKAKNVEVWKEFEIRFNQVHGNFYTSLLRAYPGLSPAEQRLCALLRMNMSTKDISELIGVHPRSVDNSRSKIRKKLGLNPEDNLVSFLSKI